MSDPRYGDIRDDGYTFVGWTIKRGKRYQAWRSPAGMAKWLAHKEKRRKRAFFQDRPEKLATIRGRDAQKQQLRRAEKGHLINGQRRDAYKANGAKIRERNLKWRKANWVAVLESRSRPQYAIAAKVRSRVVRAVKQQGVRKSSSTETLLGCSTERLMQHLESLFKPGMAWNNHGRDGWHIDHVRPCSSFNLLDSEEQKKCFHYTNMQPLWSEENLAKGSKIQTTR